MIFKKVRRTSISGLLFLWASQAFATDLKPQGKIVSKEESQALNKACSAHREYPVLEGLSDRKVEAKLNQAFAKILTVGKRLKESDCPAKDSNEIYNYSNSFTVGAQRGRYLGIAFFIYFPGGSGRITQDCRIFDLQTGDELRLKKYFKSSSLQWLQEAFEDEFGPMNREWHPEGLTKSTQQQTLSPFCLVAGGIEVMNSPHEKVPHTLLMEPNDFNKVFRDAPEIRILKVNKQ